MFPKLALALAFTGCAPLDADELPPGALRRFGTVQRPSLFSSCDIGTFAVALSPDGTQLATGEAQQLRVWDLARGELLWTHPNRGTVHALRFSPDGRRLAFGGVGNSFGLLDLSTGAVVREPEVGICVGFFASFSADGRRLLSDGPGSRGARRDQALLWDLESGTLLRRLELSGSLWRGLLTPDGGTAVTADNQSRVLFWNTDTGRRLGELRVEGGAVLDLSMDAAGRRVAAVSSAPAPSVCLIDVETRRVLRRIPREQVIRAVALRGDGRFVAMAGNGRGIDIHDTETGARVQRLAGHRGGCSSLCFDAGGSRLLSGGFHGSALLWQLRLPEPTPVREPELDRR